MRITTTAFSADQQRDFIKGWKNAAGDIWMISERVPPRGVVRGIT